MILLIVFAFLAGVVTVLSPCILPILPIVLSSTVGGKETGKARPLGVVSGFVLSFTFFTLFLSTIVRLSGIPADVLRIVSVVVIAGFGVSFLIPQFQLLVERLFSRIAQFVPRGEAKSGFWSGLIIGFSIGLLWTPCVGPILASVISLAITGTVTLDSFVVTLAYAVGTAIPMFAVVAGGRSLLRKVPWLLANTENIQRVFGLVMILMAVAILNNYDREFQTYILEAFPQYGAGLTKLEDNQKVRDELDSRLRGNDKGGGGGDIKKQAVGKPIFDLQPRGTKAPEIVPGGVWFNSNPLTLAQLRGKVVLLDFWTYSCINCQRTLPYLKKWYAMYKDKGLVIIGVHSPEFEFEKNKNNVAKALQDFGVKYPVVQDNNFATWRAYNNEYWPAKYLIDTDGYIRYTHFGEGEYDKTEGVIQELLKEAGRKDVSMPISDPGYTISAGTPETYLGYARIDRFASLEEIVPNEEVSFSAPEHISDDGVAFTGKWLVTSEYAKPEKGSGLLLNFSAKEVFLVMRPAGSVSGKVKVFIDGKVGRSLGEDDKGGVVTVDSDRLYKLIRLSDPGRHLLRLEFEDGNVEVYAFTFG